MTEQSNEKLNQTQNENQDMTKKPRSKLWRWGLIGGFTAVVIFGFTACGGYKMMHGSINEKVDYVSYKITKKLDLSPEQEQKLDVLNEQIVALATQIRDNKEQNKQAVLDIIGNSTFDREKAKVLLDSKTKLINENGNPIIESLADFYDSLDADQQALIREKLAKHHGGRHFGHF